MKGLKRQDAVTQTEGDFGFTGIHTNDPAADFLLGLSSSFYQQAAQRRPYMHNRQFEAYFQDDWKATRRLTLNMGVREVYFSSDTAEGNGFTDFNPKLFNPANAPVVLPSGNLLLDANRNPLTQSGALADPLNGLVFAGQNGVPRGIFVTPKINLSPRFGFAWDVFGNGKTAIRGGYGITYFRLPWSVLSSFGNPPSVDSISLLNGTLTNPTLGLPPTTVTPLSLVMMGPPDTLNRPEMAQTWSLTAERQVVPNGILSVAYVGSGARQLSGGQDINFPTPVSAPTISDPNCLRPGQSISPGGFNFDPCINAGLVSEDYTRPFHGYTSIYALTGASTYLGTSNYNSLQVAWNYRPARALNITAAYTYGKALSDVASRGAGFSLSGTGEAANFNGYAQNPRDWEAEYGPVGWDRTQMFSSGYVYNIPLFAKRSDLVGKALGGWTFSGITVIESGFAYSPSISGDLSPGLASRPNLVGKLSFPKTLQQWFDPSAFSAPAFGFFGNAGNGSIRGPGQNTWNWALFKSFPIGERVKMEFRSEFFNIWNHPSFRDMDTTLGDPNFGQVTSALDPRVIEFALRLSF